MQARFIEAPAGIRPDNKKVMIQNNHGGVDEACHMRPSFAAQSFDACTEPTYSTKESKQWQSR